MTVHLFSKNASNEKSYGNDNSIFQLDSFSVDVFLYTLQFYTFFLSSSRTSFPTTYCLRGTRSYFLRVSLIFLSFSFLCYPFSLHQHPRSQLKAVDKNKTSTCILCSLFSPYCKQLSFNCSQRILRYFLLFVQERVSLIRRNSFYRSHQIHALQKCCQRQYSYSVHKNTLQIYSYIQVYIQQRESIQLYVSLIFLHCVLDEGVEKGIRRRVASIKPIACISEMEVIDDNRCKIRPSSELKSLTTNELVCVISYHARDGDLSLPIDVSNTLRGDSNYLCSEVKLNHRISIRRPL